MSDYIPVYTPANTFTSTASATVTGGQVLEVSGSGTVAATSGTSAKVIGVAAHDAAANALVTVHGRGKVHASVASGGISAGAQVVSAADGKVASLAASGTSGNAAADINTAANNARSVLGIALTTVQSGETVLWMEI